LSYFTAFAFAIASGAICYGFQKMSGADLAERAGHDVLASEGQADALFPLFDEQVNAGILAYKLRSMQRSFS
jgi:hypothetical protein